MHSNYNNRTRSTSRRLERVTRGNARDDPTRRSAFQTSRFIRATDAPPRERSTRGRDTIEHFSPRPTRARAIARVDRVVDRSSVDASSTAFEVSSTDEASGSVDTVCTQRTHIFEYDRTAVVYRRIERYVVDTHIQHGRVMSQEESRQHTRVSPVPCALAERRCAGVYV